MSHYRAGSRLAFSGLAFITLAGCGVQQIPVGQAPENQPASQPRAVGPVGKARPGAPTEIPAPPLALAKPDPPSKEFQGRDLSQMNGQQLAAAATESAGKGDYRAAVQLQYWSVAALDDGRYNLSCWQALAGNKEAAFYWLQEAAFRDGVDSGWAGQDSDLESLRRDQRWGRVAAFLEACNAYWSASGHHRAALVLPEGYKPGTPIGAVVWMHGLGADPDGFVSDSVQEFANELNLAIIGVSGTVPRGPHSFVWSEDAVRDAEQIRRAIKELSDRVTVRPGAVVTIGFSQGAQMAFEVAFRYPDEFRGALVMSPGTSKPVNLGGFAPGPGNRKQGFVCTCGAAELPGNVAMTKADADLAKSAGSRVELKLYEGVREHAFPSEFAQKFVTWIRTIQGTDPFAPGSVPSAGR